MASKNQFTFWHLNYDIFEDIIKYLSFKHLIKYKLIDKTWKEAIESYFASLVCISLASPIQCSSQNHEDYFRQKSQEYDSFWSRIPGLRTIQLIESLPILLRGISQKHCEISQFQAPSRLQVKIYKNKDLKAIRTSLQLNYVTCLTIKIECKSSKIRGHGANIIGVGEFCKFLEQFPSLSCLTITGIRFKYSRHSFPGFRKAFLRMTELEHLSLENANGKAGQVPTDFERKTYALFKGLKSIGFAHPKNVESSDVINEDTKHIRFSGTSSQMHLIRLGALISKAKNLHSLKIENDISGHYNSNMSKIVDLAPKIRHFTFRVLDHGAKRMAVHLAKLKRLQSLELIFLNSAKLETGLLSHILAECIELREIRIVDDFTKLEMKNLTQEYKNKYADKLITFSHYAIN